MIIACSAFFIVGKKSRSRESSCIYDSRDLLSLPLFIQAEFDLHLRLAMTTSMQPHGL